jgi:hypothetical protein
MEYVFSLADMNNTSMSTVMSASYSNLINTGLTEATPADYSVVKKAYFYDGLRCGDTTISSIRR